MIPGDTPPGGGQWVGEWESTTGCWHNTDFRGAEFRDAVEPEGEPTTAYSHYAAAPGALCFKNCPKSHDLENHHQMWVATATEGWSISGSATLTIDIAAAAKLAAGVSGSYSESLAIAYRLEVPYGHSDGPAQTYREWSCSILKKTLTYKLRVRRYFKGRHGHFVEVTDNETGKDILRVEDHGTIEIAEDTYVVGSPTANDVPCESWSDPLPGATPRRSGSPKVWDPNSGPASVERWGEYRPQDAQAMALALLEGTEISARGKELLAAAAARDRKSFEKLARAARAALRGEPRAVVPGSGAWVAMLAETVERLPIEQRTAVTSAVDAWVKRKL